MIGARPNAFERKDGVRRQMPRGQKKGKIAVGRRLHGLPRDAAATVSAAGWRGSRRGRSRRGGGWFGKGARIRQGAFREMLHRRIRQGSWWPFLFAREFLAER